MIHDDLHIFLYFSLYSILQEYLMWEKRGGKKKKSKTGPQSESVMSAQPRFQDVRHGTPVHIYSFLLPGEYRMKTHESALMFQLHWHAKLQWKLK